MKMMNKPFILLGPSTFAAENREPLERLHSAGCKVIDNPYKRKLTKDELKQLLNDKITGLIAGLETLDKEVLAGSKLKVISRCGAGMSNIDMEAAKEFGILVYNTPYGPTQAVAELTIGCLLALLRKVPQMDSALHSRKWDKRIGYQLKGKVVLIIGYGRIGKTVGEILGTLGVSILICDPAYSGADGVKNVELNQALGEADIVTLHCGGENPLLGAKEFALMKKGIFLLNSARGSLVDEIELCKALDSGKVAGAWFDTFAKEPYEGALTKYDQVILTPHVGSYTHEGRLQMELEAVDNLLDGFRKLEAK